MTEPALLEMGRDSVIMNMNKTVAIFVVAGCAVASGAAQADKRKNLGWDYLQANFVMSETTIDDGQDLDGDGIVVQDVEGSGYSLELMKTFGSKWLFHGDYFKQTLEQAGGDIDQSWLSLGIGIIPEDDGFKHRGFFFNGTFERLTFSGGNRNTGTQQIDEDGWGIGGGWRGLFFKGWGEFEARIRYVDIDESDGFISSMGLTLHPISNLAVTAKLELRRLTDDGQAQTIEYDEQVLYGGLRYYFGDED